jgi:DNA-binding transcriptional LysR family regulator
MTDVSIEPEHATAAPFRVAIVPGVTPGKWSRIWDERVSGVRLEVIPVADRDQLAVLHDGRADMSFVRLPVETHAINLIPLYRETSVVVVPKEHPVEAFDEISVTDLADEHLLQDPDEVPAWRDVAVEVRDGTRLDVPSMTPKELIETVAAGAGIVILAKSVARLHDRKDVVIRPVTGVAESQIGLAWLADATDARIELFIGIVRGRTARSSRTPGPSGKPSSRGASKGRRG